MTHFAAEEIYNNKSEVVNEYPSAALVKRVTGGWMVFETQDDYRTWKNQK